MKEFIVCAAIYINDNQIHDAQPKNIEIGFVIAGRRHHNCYQTIKDLTGQDINNRYLDFVKSLTPEEARKHQGFITSLDRYVDRKEAWKIAKENNQIVYGLSVSDNGDDSILISENLYLDEN